MYFYLNKKWFSKTLKYIIKKYYTTFTTYLARNMSVYGNKDIFLVKILP